MHGNAALGNRAAALKTVGGRKRQVTRWQQYREQKTDVVPQITDIMYREIRSENWMWPERWSGVPGRRSALVVTGFILINYISLQSDITNSVQNISRLEKELYVLKLANDEEYTRITSNVDLEEIKRIAIQELGMQYAEEGQIVSFASESNDYVKQIADIPD